MGSRARDERPRGPGCRGGGRAALLAPLVALGLLGACTSPEQWPRAAIDGAISRPDMHAYAEQVRAALEPASFPEGAGPILLRIDRPVNLTSLHVNTNILREELVAVIASSRRIRPVDASGGDSSPARSSASAAAPWDCGFELVTRIERLRGVPGERRLLSELSLSSEVVSVEGSATVVSTTRVVREQEHR